MLPERLRILTMPNTREQFTALVAAGSRCDLDHAALEIARIAYPDLDPRPYLARIEAYADTLRTRIGQTLPPHQATLEVARYLFEELEFRGNSDDYYDPRNSFLNDVLDRRTGIPIALSVLLLSVTARLGLPAHGVGFPGHFLVRVDAPNGPLILDPFSGGRTLRRDELLARLRAFSEAGGGQPGSDLQRVLPQALQPTGTLEILGRMLGNLLSIYLEREDNEAALMAVDLLLIVAPDAPEPTRLRGLLYERLECYASALGDLRRYLTLAPSGPLAAEVRTRILELEEHGALH